MIFQCLDFSNQKSDSATLFLDQIHFVILLCIKKQKITPKGRQRSSLLVGGMELIQFLATLAI